MEASWSEMLDNSLTTRAVRVESGGGEDTQQTDRDKDSNEASPSCCPGPKGLHPHALTDLLRAQHKSGLW